jgi:hypothetical protein
MLWSVTGFDSLPSKSKLGGSPIGLGRFGYRESSFIISFPSPAVRKPGHCSQQHLTTYRIQ